MLDQTCSVHELTLATTPTQLLKASRSRANQRSISSPNHTKFSRVLESRTRWPEDAVDEFFREELHRNSSPAQCIPPSDLPLLKHANFWFTWLLRGSETSPLSPSENVNGKQPRTRGTKAQNLVFRCIFAARGTGDLRGCSHLPRAPPRTTR